MVGWTQTVLVFITAIVTQCPVSTLEINGVKLADKLMQIADVGLGRSKIQNFFEAKASFNSRLPRGKRGHEIVQTLAQSVGSRFNVHNDVIKGLHAVIEKYDQKTNANTTAIMECCKTRGMVIPQMCFERPGTTAKVPIAFPVEILEKMEQIHKNSPYIKWSYFGNEKGEFFLYPSDPGPDDNCDDYDPRLRPWYAEASAPTPKDIVIALDISSPTNSTLIKQAVEVLLETTNPNDRITVIKFGGGLAWTYLGSSDHSTCFSQDLALATPQNRKAFIDFIHAAEEAPHGVTKYQLAIIKAFRYFHRAADATKRSKLLVFLAGSDPQDVQTPGDIRSFIIDQNKELDQKVVIQTYAVGKGISQNTEDILRAMAESTSFNTSNNINIGTFTRIHDGSQLRVQLHSYYNIFSDSSSAIDPIVTVPYFDFSIVGNLVVSICLPVHQNSKLSGVTCVDADLEDIFFNVTHYHQGIDAYGFIIDNRGRTILHPLLHKPTHPLDEPVFIDISTLESNDEMSEIIASMKSGGSGEKTFLKQLSLFGRDREQSLNAQVSHYFWSKVPNTDYSLCMVFSDRDTEIAIRRQPEVSDVNYIHPYMLHSHRALCQHELVPVDKDGSVVRFTGSAYRWLSDIVDSNDGNQKQRYENFFTAGAVDQAPELKESTHWWVALTGAADNVWTEEASTKYDSIIMWRHLVTPSGVIRVYPGVNFTQYDPNVLSWYKLAILNPGQVQVQAVEKDGYFNLMVSQAISVGSPSASPVAVVGGEIRHTSLYTILEQLYPVCKDASCFIMDMEGSVLLHKAYKGREKPTSHLLTMEPSIAQYLQRSGQLVKVSCLDFEKYRTVFSWKMSLRGWFIKSEKPRFELHVVPGTNLYIGISWDRPTSSTCNCETLSECKHHSDGVCQCPCFQVLKFNSCNNTLPERNRNAIPVCSVLKADFDIIPPPDRNIAMNNRLPRCLFAVCEKYRVRRDCVEHNGCAWCSLDGAEVPGCYHQGICSPHSASSKEFGRFINLPIIIAFVFIVIIILLAVLALIIRRTPGLRKKCSGLIWPKTKALETSTTAIDSSQNTTVEIRPPARQPPIYAIPGSGAPEYEIIGNGAQDPIILPYVADQLNSCFDPSLPSSFTPIAQSSGFSVAVPADMDESDQIVTYSPIQTSSSGTTLSSEPPKCSNQSGQSEAVVYQSTTAHPRYEIPHQEPPNLPPHAARSKMPQDFSMKPNTTMLDAAPLGPTGSNTTKNRQSSDSVYSNEEADQKPQDYGHLDLSLGNLDKSFNASHSGANAISSYSGVRYIAAQPESSDMNSSNASYKTSDSGLESELPKSQTEPKQFY